MSQYGSASAAPSAGDLVLLAYSRFIGEPDFQPVKAAALVLDNAFQRRDDVFLNASMAPFAWS